MIKKIGNKWVVLSETTVRRGARRVHRKFGTYATKREAVKRLGQVEFFKHAKGKRKGKRKR